MHFLRKIIFLLLFIISFSCQTQLEKQGWQRIAIVSQFDTSTINKKDKELVVGMMRYKGSYYYSYYFFEKNSTGKIIINKPEFVFERSFKSEIAYYKWESDSVCFVKLLNNGNVQASIKYIKHNDSSSSNEILNEPGK
ncbi:MAG: hypothetical protein ABJA71_16750 [Ginsengibacter sp.]